MIGRAQVGVDSRRIAATTPLRRRPRRGSLGVLCVALAMLLPASGCGIHATPWGVIAIPPGAPILLGIATDQDSAPVETDSPRAGVAIQSEQAGLVRGHVVQTVPVPVHCSEDGAAAAVPRAEALSGIVGLLGPPCSRGCIYAEGLLYDTRLTMLAPACTAAAVVEQGFPIVFRLAWNDSDQGAVAAHYAASSLHVKRVVAIHDSTVFGRTLSTRFARTFAADGGSATQIELPASGTVDLQRLERMVRAANPGAIALWVDRPDAAQLFQQLSQRSGDTPLIAGDTVFARPGCPLASSDPSNLAAAATCLGVEPGAPRFVSAGVWRHSDAWYSEIEAGPTTLSFQDQTQDAVQVYIAALTKAARLRPDGSLLIQKQPLRNALAQTGGTGLTGRLAFDSAGERRHDVGAALYQIDGSAWKLVEQTTR